jgi:hypothetical protein
VVTIDDVATSPQASKAWMAALAFVALVATPFVVTGLYRLVPSSLPGWEVIPSAAVVVGAVGVGVRRRRWRLVAGAVAISATLWFVAIAIVIASFSNFGPSFD